MGGIPVNSTHTGWSRSWGGRDHALPTGAQSLSHSGVSPMLLQHSTAGPHWHKSHHHDRCDLLPSQRRLARKTNQDHRDNALVYHYFLLSFLMNPCLWQKSQTVNKLNRETQKESCQNSVPAAARAHRQRLKVFSSLLISMQMCVRCLQHQDYTTM